MAADRQARPEFSETPAAEEQPEDRLPSWGKVFSYFFLLGFINIGGPVAQITMMFNHMVEKQHWLTKDRFTKILAFCHMLPGPEALQLAIYVGYLKRGLIGGTLAGATFIIPGAAVMVLLSYLYVTYGSLPQVNDILFVLKPAVLGIIAAGIIKLGKAAIKNLFLGGVVIGSILAMVVGRLNFLLVLFLAGFINLAYAELTAGTHGRSKALSIVPLAWGGLKVGFWSGAKAGWVQIAWLFLKTGALSFGGAYASLIFVQHGAVEEFHWLTDGQLLDGVALSVATPGPFMLFTTFVGYMAAGIPGAVITTFFVFLPSFVFVMAGARYVELLRGNRYIQAFLAGGSAAVVGIILVVSLKLVPDAVAGGAPSYIIAALAFLAITWRRIDVAMIAIAAILAGIGYATIHYLY
jgi:chromate transporter